MTLHHEGCLCDIGVACICTASDEYLLNRLLLDFAYRDNVVRLMRAGDQRLKLAQIDLHLTVVLTALIWKHLYKFIFTSLRSHKFANLLICREDRGRRPHLCTHVCDRHTLGNFKSFCTRSYILVHISETALDRYTAKHLKNNFLGVYTRTKFSGQIYLDDSRHFQSHRDTGHCCRDVHTTNTDTQHANCTAVRSMAVTTHRKLARCAETGYLNGMAYSVTRTGNMYTKTLCCRL